MNVLFLTNIPSPYRVEFFNELGKHCKLTVLFERTSAKDREQQWLLNSFNTFTAHFLSGVSIGNDSALCFSILDWLKNKKYDLIVIGGYSTPTGMLAIEFLNLNNIPFILNSDGGLIKSDNKLRYKLKRHFISKASGWLSTGKETNKYLLYYGAKEAGIYNYPFTSIKAEDILCKLPSIVEKEELKKKNNLLEDIIIISVGQFIYRKGFDVLLKACKFINRNVGIYIIGGTPTSEYLKMREEMDLQNVHFIGFKSKLELKEYYLAADLFVLPTREDIWGLVINEAMASGLPIITTDKCVAGLELVEDGKNGYIISSNNDEELAHAVNKILEKEVLLKEMSLESLEKIKKYTIENMAREHILIFRDFLKRQGRCRIES